MSDDIKTTWMHKQQLIFVLFFPLKDLAMTRERLIVVSDDAAGMSAASQARRRNAELEIIAFKRGPYTSYSS